MRIKVLMIKFDQYIILYPIKLFKLNHVFWNFSININTLFSNFLCTQKFYHCIFFCHF